MAKAITTATQSAPRRCTRCGLADGHDLGFGNLVMLAHRDGKLVCADCDGELENEWVAEDPTHNRHYLDTFAPGRAQ